MGGAFEVLTMGRIGVDVYPLQVGKSLREVETFGKYLGGSATNVAVAAARYGRRTAVITRTGADPFGEFLHDALRGFGVDDRFVTAVPDLPTPVTFCEIFPPDDFPLYFYRLPKAPDLEIYENELDYDAIRGAGVFWVTVTGLSQEPSRSATLHALRAREQPGTLSWTSTIGRCSGRPGTRRGAGWSKPSRWSLLLSGTGTRSRPRSEPGNPWQQPRHCTTLASISPSSSRGRPESWLRETAKRSSCRPFRSRS